MFKPVLALCLTPCLLWLFCSCPPARMAQAETEAIFAAPSLVWQEVQPGLDLVTLAHHDPSTVQVTVLRIDPARFEFALHTVVWSGEQTRNISQWVEKQGLSAAINACMYLPDGRTPTAYMRQDENRTPRRVASQYGGFFVSGPRSPGLPQVDILDKNRDEWERLLPQYDIVVQNMRLLSAEGEQLWPENGPQHSVAAIARDAEGKILFIHCRDMVNVNRLVRALLAHPALNISRAIYVEGGSQTALALRTPSLNRTWTGRGTASLLLLGQDMQYPLPSVIGVKPR